MTPPTQSLSNSFTQTSAISHSASAGKNSKFANTPAAGKLRQAAAEFESMLLASLWKSMKDSFATQDDDSTDPAHDTLDSLGMQSMSAAVGKAGGLGLGKLILKHLEPLAAKAGSQTL